MSALQNIIYVGKVVYQLQMSTNLKYVCYIYAVIKTCNESSPENGFLQANNAILFYNLSSFLKAAT